MNYIEALQNRYSVKKFDSEKIIPNEVISRILEAGKLSASSLGLQPYHILVVESREIKEKLIPAFHNSSQVSTCSHLIAIVTRKKIDQEYVGNYFRHISEVRNTALENLEGFRKSISGYLELSSDENMVHWNEKQGYLLLANLMFAAALEQIDTCPMEGFSPEKAGEVLGINPETEKVTVTLALGYRAEDDPYQNLKKVRKPNEKLFRFL